MRKFNGIKGLLADEEKMDELKENALIVGAVICPSFISGIVSELAEPNFDYEQELSGLDYVKAGTFALSWPLFVLVVALADIHIGRMEYLIGLGYFLADAIGCPLFFQAGRCVSKLAHFINVNTFEKIFAKQEIDEEELIKQIESLNHNSLLYLSTVIGTYRKMYEDNYMQLNLKVKKLNKLNALSIDRKTTNGLYRNGEIPEQYEVTINLAIYDQNSKKKTIVKSQKVYVTKDNLAYISDTFNIPDLKDIDNVLNKNNEYYLFNPVIVDEEEVFKFPNGIEENTLILKRC